MGETPMPPFTISPVLRALRILGYLEGTSFLVLLLIAMPIKYLADNPIAVKNIGALHGALFVLYLVVGFAVGLVHKWNLKRFATLVLASAIPLGTFVFDGALKREEQAG